MNSTNQPHEAGKHNFQHTMSLYEENFIPMEDVPILLTDLPTKSAIIGRIGIMFLACGTGAWRIREAMNRVARNLDVICSVSLGIRSLEYTCYQGNESLTRILSIPNVGVNTNRLADLERLVDRFKADYLNENAKEIHHQLDAIQAKKGLHSTLVSCLASGVACGAFIFLLGGGIIELFCTFIGAFIGQFFRKKMLDKQLTLTAWIILSVFMACLFYGISFYALAYFLPIKMSHQAGYIGAMLFIVPGFPFITSCLDLAKLYMRSGIERLVYSILILAIATLSAWVAALVLNLQPQPFVPQDLSPLLLFILRIIASFCGVYGFSILFNSPHKMAATAGLIGAVSNTLRLELIDVFNFTIATAALVAAIVAGLCATFFNKEEHYPRIALTVPSIVIMVPGFYIYTAVYYMSDYQIGQGATWATKALLILLCLPLGLTIARMITDKEFRYCT